MLGGTRGIHLSGPLRLAATKSTEPLRINPVGIQKLSPGLHRQLFPGVPLSKPPTPSERRLIELSKQHLGDNELLGKKCSINPPINFKLPALQGRNLAEHFQRLGRSSCAEYLPIIEDLLRLGKAPPALPKKWLFKSGWTRYAPDKPPESVEYPLEDALVFDVETLYKLSPYPVMATCMTPNAWYGWVSPYLTNESDQLDGHLIPLGLNDHRKIVVGHNVSYDRARIAEEYSLAGTGAFFLDTMSLHIAVSGMCSQQRATWMKYKRQLKDQEDQPDSLHNLRAAATTPELKRLLENPDLDSAVANSADLSDSEASVENDPWLKHSTLNGLKHVAKMYCGIKMNKETRDVFSEKDPQLIRDDFQNLMTYCAGDVDATYKVFLKIYPRFRQLVPHDVSLAALRHINQSYLPTTHEWEKYIERSESQYQEGFRAIESKLIQLCEEVVQLKDRADEKPWENDPWLKQLDWTIAPIKYTKSGKPYKRQKLPGYPEWYKKLVVKNELVLTTKTRIAPLLLRLSWEGKPVFWTDTYGWCFEVDRGDEKTYEDKNYIRIKDGEIMEKEPKIYDAVAEILETKTLFKVPHESGPTYRTTSLMSKPFLRHFEKGVLSSKFQVAKDALTLAVSNSYWQSSRERIMNQFVVFNDKHYTDMAVADPDMGVILPQVVSMGTITRRAVEKTWLTASNAKATRLGSELKAMVHAPKGYCFVGADVDSEELWIASLMGDSVFKMHGGTALGWMTLEGDKSQGTDLHSKTAKILGISRGEAKVFNYGRIYGAGLAFATTLLNKFNPSLTEEEAVKTARKLYAATKGKSNMLKGSRIWYGGSESVVFNRLEQISQQENPKTPVLSAGITAALRKKNLNSNTFLPSRMNWTIQSSGVDYLHLLLVSIEYLCKVFSVPVRLCMTVHDEVRYIAKLEDRYKLGMIMQIANLWTRGMFCHQVGLNDLPQGCAFFSAVDFDQVVRKEVDMDCITPSNINPIEHGESLDIYALMEKPEVQAMLNSPQAIDLSEFPVHKAAKPIEMLDSTLDAGTRGLLVAMQIAQTPKQFQKFKSKYLNNLEIQEGQRFGETMDSMAPPGFEVAFKPEVRAK